MEQKFIAIKTPVGFLVMNLDKEGRVVESTFSQVKTMDETDENHPYTKLIRQYFDGDLSALSRINFCINSSSFYEKVYSEMAKIPPGETLSYKELATRAGNPNAVRAVGTACKKNKLPLIVPCHRVIKSDGSLGEYVFGPKMKNFLLNHEGISIK